jgi:head-tail adaptor
MTLFDASDSMSFIDATETVSLVRRGGEESTISNALKRRLMTNDAAATDGSYTASDVTWHLSTGELADPPAVGDLLRDGSGVAWTVLEVAESRQSGRWICRARQLAIAGGLDSLVRIQRATWSKGKSGDAVATWHDVQVGVLARIQPERSVVEVEHGKRDVTVTHKIYLAAAIALDEDHRIVHGDTVYRVVSQEKEERIDQLSVVNVVESPPAVNA